MFDCVTAAALLILSANHTAQGSMTLPWADARLVLSSQ